MQSDAKKILEQLRAAGPHADNEVVGDPLMLPNEMGLTRLSAVSRIFGRQFADGIFQLEPGRWTGPVSSGYGLHLVYVTERKESRMPTFAEVRPAVEREFLAARRKEALKTMYKGMLERYHITIEQRAGEQGTASAATDPVKGDSL